MFLALRKDEIGTKLWERFYFAGYTPYTTVKSKTQNRHNNTGSVCQSPVAEKSWNQV